MFSKLFRPNIKELEKRRDFKGLIDCFRYKDPDLNIPIGAARALGRLNDPACLADLNRALEDAEYLVRECAVIAMGGMKRPECLPVLLKALKVEGYPVRESVVIALGELGEPRAVPDLIQTLFNETKSPPDFLGCSASAAKALGKIGTEEAIEALAAFIEKAGFGSWWEKWSAKQGIKEATNPEAVNILLKLLTGRNDDLRDCAVSALGHIGGEGVVEALLRTVKEYPTINGLEALAQTGSVAGAEYLLETALQGCAIIREHNLIEVEYGVQVKYTLDGFGRMPRTYQKAADLFLEMKENSTQAWPADLDFLEKCESLKGCLPDLEKVTAQTNRFYCRRCNSWRPIDSEHRCVGHPIDGFDQNKYQEILRLVQKSKGWF